MGQGAPPHRQQRLGPARVVAVGRQRAGVPPVGSQARRGGGDLLLGGGQRRGEVGARRRSFGASTWVALRLTPP
jgi:hypothetical protein